MNVGFIRFAHKVKAQTGGREMQEDGFPARMRIIFEI